MKKFLPPLVVALIVFCAWLLTHRGTPKDTVSGTIEADEVRVGSRFGGRVTEIFAAEGDSLTNGQAIAKLDAPELRARRDEVAAMLAELEAGPRSQEIASASNEWQALSADLDLARTERKRADELFAQKTISESERDSADRNANAIAQRAAAAQQRFEELSVGTRPERIAQVRAQLAEIDAQLAEMNVVAPSAAALETLQVKVGDMVPLNGAVATLVLGGDRWVRVYIPETWLGHVKVGDEARVGVDAFPGQAFKGSVVQVNRKAEFTPRNVQTVDERIRQVFGVKVRLDDPDGRLQPGMAADVNFPSVK